MQLVILETMSRNNDPKHEKNKRFKHIYVHSHIHIYIFIVGTTRHLLAFSESVGSFYLLFAHFGLTVGDLTTGCRLWSAAVSPKSIKWEGVWSYTLKLIQSTDKPCCNLCLLYSWLQTNGSARLAHHVKRRSFNSLAYDQVAEMI